MNKNKKSKTNYVAPTVHTRTIELEQGIAASSAKLVPGGTTNGSGTPEVENWISDPATDKIDRDLY